MSCIHYQKGACALTVRESIKTVWVGHWPTIKTVREMSPCSYDSSIWIGDQRYAGRTLEGDPVQTDCPLYRSNRTPTSTPQ